MKLAFFAVFLVFILLIIVIIFLTQGLIFRYIKRIQSEFIIALLTRIHLAAAFVLGVFLPNNYLNQFQQINQYYAASGLWILASIFIVFIITFVVIGVILNILLLLLGFKPTNTEAYEAQLGYFSELFKRKVAGSWTEIF